MIHELIKSQKWWDSDTFQLSTNNKNIKVILIKKCNNYQNFDKSSTFNMIIWYENMFISEDNPH